MNGFIGYGSQGNLAYPSPSIWGDCPNGLLNDKALGRYMALNFLGDAATPAATTTAPGIEIFSDQGTVVVDYAASGTFGPGVLSLATGATDKDNASIHGEELGQIKRGSGQKFWFEARVAPTLLGDTSFFIGLTTRAGARATTNAGSIIADDPSNSAVATTQAVSTIGFLSAQTASAIATVNARYTKTSGSPVTVLADVTNATAFSNFQAALPSGTVITQAAQVTNQATNPPAENVMTAYGNLVAAAFRKYGIRFDGGKYLYFYVDGVQVARQEVDTTVDQTSYYVPVIAAKNGASTALTLNIGFLRAGYQARN